MIENEKNNYLKKEEKRGKRKESRVGRRIALHITLRD